MLVVRRNLPNSRSALDVELRRPNLEKNRPNPETARQISEQILPNLEQRKLLRNQPSQGWGLRLSRVLTKLPPKRPRELPPKMQSFSKVAARARRFLQLYSWSSLRMCSTSPCTPRYLYIIYSVLSYIAHCTVFILYSPICNRKFYL